MKHSKHQSNQASVSEIRRRIRFLQRSLVQLLSQPQVQRQRLVKNLYASLHQARQELRRVQHSEPCSGRAVA